MSYERLELIDGVTKWDAEKVNHLESGIIANEKAIDDINLNEYVKYEYVEKDSWNVLGSNIGQNDENVVLSGSVDINNLHLRLTTLEGQEDIITNKSNGLTISRKDDGTYVLVYLSGVENNTTVYEFRLKGNIDGSGVATIPYIDLVTPTTTLTVESLEVMQMSQISESLIPDTIARTKDIPILPKEMEPATTDIPRIFFNDTLQTIKDYKVVKFEYHSKTNDFKGYAKIKMQGNFSTTFPKKNQTIKLYEDEKCTTPLNVEFRNWGEHNKYVLKANWTDITHSRNVVSARLWGDIVSSRENNIVKGPNYGAVDGFPVKVYAKGVYQGRYTLNIPKEDWMFDLDSSNKNATFIYSDGYTNGGCFTNTSTLDWKDKVHGGDSEILTGNILTKWSNALNFVVNSKNAAFKSSLKDYMDVDSVLDYYLFNLLNCGLDAFGKNQVFVTYDKDDVWHASAYDMDATWGQYYDGTMLPHDYDRTQYEDYKNVGGNKLYQKIESVFSTELLQRWKELKNGPLSVENILNRFEEFIEIAPQNLVEEDYASTTANGAFVNIPSKDTNNLQQIRQCVLDRHAYVENYLWNL